MSASRFKRCGSGHTFFFALCLVALAAAPSFTACLGAGRLPPPLSGGRLDNAAEREARRLYERAVAEVGERRYERAYAAFDSVVTRYPASRYSGLSVRERGFAAYRLGRHARAAADLRRFLELAPGYETTETAIVLASAVQLGGDPEAALRTLVRYLPASDQHADGARTVAQASIRRLEAGAAPRLAAELPERAFLAPLFARAAEEVRDRDPRRAAELARTADRLASDASGARGGRVSVEDPRPRRGSAVVGAILPETGRLGSVGRDIEDGVRLALEELAEQAGPRYTLEVLPEQGAEGTRSSLDQLAERGVEIVIGPLESDAALTAGAVAIERDVLVVSPTATDSTLAHLGPRVVSLNVTRGELGRAMGGFAARELRLLRVAVLASDDDYGRANAAGFGRAFGEGGGEVVLQAFFLPGTSNFGASLRRARHAGAEALFLPMRSADQVLTIVSQMEYYSGGRFRLLGTEVWRDERFLRRAGAFAEGAYVVDTFSPEPQVTRYWEFRREYSERYGRELPNNFPAWGYDAAMLALRYLSGSSDSPLEETYVGAAATYRVRDGEVAKVPVISVVRSGAPALVSIEEHAR